MSVVYHLSSATYCEGAIFPIHNKYGDSTYLAIHIYKVDEATLNTLLEKRGIRVGDAYLDSPIEYDVGFEASNLSFCGGHASPSSCAYLLRYTYMDVIVKIVLGNMVEGFQDWYYANMAEIARDILFRLQSCGGI